MLKSPILFLIFNRPDLTKKVFESIKKVKPQKLYIASDGARLDRQGELELVQKSRQIVNNINWDCEVNLLFRDQNLGCKIAVSQSISWFLENEEEGIILEDDCLPNIDFFSFCDTLLHKYRFEEKIWAIAGTNFLSGLVNEQSYHFSRINHVWGWATWRRAWKNYDVNLELWPKYKKSSDWSQYWRSKKIRNYWESVFELVHKKKIDTWDYQWTATMWFHNGLAIIPSVNLVTNIGFGLNATHTKNTNSNISNLESYNLKIRNHPVSIINNLELDLLVHKKFILPKKSYFLTLIDNITSIFKNHE